MTEPELRALLMAIRDLGLIGRMHPEERIKTPACGPLLFALGTIGGLATVALEGTELPPQRIEISEEAFGRLTHNEAVVMQTQFGYRVELSRRRL
jgi:hypothetical protein